MEHDVKQKYKHFLKKDDLKRILLVNLLLTLDLKG
jgi:hypothetical protein